MPFKLAQVPSHARFFPWPKTGSPCPPRLWGPGTGPGPQLRRHRSGCLPGSSSRHQGNHPAILEPADAEPRGDPVVPAMPTSLSRGDRTTGTHRTRCHGAVRRAEVPLPDMSSGFFSLSVPRCDLMGHGFSPSVLRKIVIAGGSHPSFGLAAKMLGQLAEVTISGRQVGRITEEIGQEMAEKRDLKTNQFQDKTLASAVIGVPRVAVVEMDGGRFLARGCGSGPGSHEASWKEDKIACLVTMGGDLFDRDPHPELPACFRDRKAVAKLVRGVGRAGTPGDLVEEAAEEDQAAEMPWPTPRTPPLTSWDGYRGPWCEPAWRQLKPARLLDRWWRQRPEHETSIVPSERHSGGRGRGGRRRGGGGREGKGGGRGGGKGGRGKGGGRGGERGEGKGEERGRRRRGRGGGGEEVEEGRRGGAKGGSRGRQEGVGEGGERGWIKGEREGGRESGPRFNAR